MITGRDWTGRGYIVGDSWGEKGFRDSRAETQSRWHVGDEQLKRDTERDVGQREMSDRCRTEIISVNPSSHWVNGGDLTHINSDG